MGRERARSMTATRVSLEAFGERIRRALEQLSSRLERGWLVGGALRDALTGEPIREIDLAVPAGALALGRALADERPYTSFVVLDERRGVCRLVAEVPIDIADLRASSLSEDLRARDFTVNALAVPLSELVRSGSAGVEDATGGLDDLAGRIVRACGPRALLDDPVRALRAVRLTIQPGWRLDPATAALIRDAAPRVSEVAAERARDELTTILTDARAGAGLRLLDELGVLPVLLPESFAMRKTAQPEPHRFDVWEHSLRAVEAADEIVSRLDAFEPWTEELSRHMAEPLGDGLARRELLKLAALLHDIAKPETRRLEGERVRFFGHDVIGAEHAAAVARRWRLSRRATAVLERLVRQHLRPMHLANAGVITRRARYRFFRDLGEDARDLLLLTVADAAAVAGHSPLAVWSGAAGDLLRDLMEGMAEESRAAETPPLVRGQDIMAAFALRAGPRVGRLLARAREAQALGLVHDRAEALSYLRRVAETDLDTQDERPLE
jgi:poly(A) polymerase